MNVLIAYSSLTGNTKFLCSEVYKQLKDDIDVELKSVNEAISYEAYDLIVVGFWVDKGTANKEAKNFIKSIKDKSVILLGTLGASPESEHADKVRERVAKLPHKSVNFKGVYLARGQVKTKFMENIKKLPLPKSIKDKMYEASIDSRPPNQQEINEAEALVRQHLL